MKGTTMRPIIGIIILVTGVALICAVAVTQSLWPFVALIALCAAMGMIDRGR